MSSSEKTAAEFGGFFGVLGGLTGCTMVAEGAQGDDAWLILLIGFGIGYFLGYVIGHVVWRLILIALFILVLWIRMEACGAFREGVTNSSYILKDQTDLIATAATAAISMIA